MCLRKQLDITGRTRNTPFTFYYLRGSKMGTCGIYKIENKINHKVYIGQSINIERRWTQHRYRSQSGDGEAFDCALYKDMYGHLSDFDFSILEECPRDMLDIQEIDWIRKYDSTAPWNGYNRSPGGGQSIGHPGVYNKLTKEKVMEIVDRLRNTTESQTAIAKDYGVTQQVVSCINSGLYYIEDVKTFPIRSPFYRIEANGMKVACGKSSGGPRVVVPCEKCGKLHAHGGRLCMDCYKEELHKKMRESVTREELKLLIREIPFEQIGCKFGVTGSAIKKWCDYYKLPRRKRDINNYTDSEWEKI